MRLEYRILNKKKILRIITGLIFFNLGFVKFKFD